MNEKVAKVGNWVLFVFCLPYLCVASYLVVALSIVLFFAHKPRMLPYRVLGAQWRPWWVKIWKYSTTFGRSIIYQPRVVDETPEVIDNPTENHEMVHVRQVEDRMVLAFCVGLVVFLVTGNWILGLALWTSGGVWQLPNFLTTVLRGGHIYRDSEHERSASAQTRTRGWKQGKSWLDHHLSKPRDW